ncbi:MAG: Gfo/Idh/MocA family oxidoreductase [Thermoguttaceae bacterium]
MSLRVPRREFLHSALTVSAGSLMASCWPGKTVAGAAEPASKNDRFRLALIGCGERGMDIGQHAAAFGDYRAIVDLDRNRAQAAKAHFGGKADVYQDYRRVIDRQDIDAVICAVPDHWHTAINIAVCKSGKDLYTEKPLTLTVDEGRILCRVVKETKRVVQVGTMQRSQKCFQTAVELVRNGRIGKLKSVTVTVPFFNTKGGPFHSEPVPPGFDWEMYQGQAALHDYCPQRTHHSFRWWYEYAGGIATDWGNHHMDIAHWGMDQELAGPTSVEGVGKFPNEHEPDYRKHPDRFFNTPDRFSVKMEYPGGLPLLFNAVQVGRDGIVFIGDRGKLHVNRGGMHGLAAEELAGNPLPEGGWRVRTSGTSPDFTHAHIENFFECIRTRAEPVAPVRIEHRTATACHLANISIRLKRKIVWDPVKEQIVGDEEANACLKRRQRAPYFVKG